MTGFVSKKTLRLVALFLTVLMLIVGAILYSNLGRIAKNAIEYYGPSVLGAAVKVSSVGLSPFSGNGEIKGLIISNPPGFSEAHLMKVGRAYLSVDLSSLRSNRIHIYSVEIEDLDVAWEGGFSNSNLAQVQRHAAKFAATMAPKAEKSAQSEVKVSVPERRFIIDHLVVKNIVATAHLKGLVGISLPIPNIEMKDLGKNSNGSTVAEVTSQVLGRVTSEITKSLAKGPSLIGNGIRSGSDFIHGLFSKPNK